MKDRREVERVVRAQEKMEGAGVVVRRSLGTPALDQRDPFLLLDEFRSAKGADYIAGFPDHPHRGFETVTYMLAGSMRHEDHRGNRGELGPGSVQWMTAGRGIIHSEMPLQKDGLMWGFQLWVNLPAAKKMTEPRYQDIPASEIPEVETAGGARVRVIAGEASGLTGPVKEIATEPLYLDLHLPAEKSFSLDVPVDHNVLCYVFEGQGRVAEESLGEGELAVLEKEGSGVELIAGASGMRALVLAAKPLGEPVARYGPFVMNTSEEITQAIADFRQGKFLD